MESPDNLSKTCKDDLQKMPSPGPSDQSQVQMESSVCEVDSSPTIGIVSQLGKRPRNPAVLILWIEDHSHNPYPTKAEKTMLALYAGMSEKQLNDWFANARRNIKKIGYPAWKEKHSTYSACFSIPGVLQNSGQPGPSGSQDNPMPDEPSLSSEAPNHSSVGPLKSSARKLQFGHKIKEETTTINTCQKSHMCNRHGFHPYYIPAHSSVLTIPPRSPNGVSTLRSIPVSINPAATYYKLSQQPSPQGVNFPSMKVQSLCVSSSGSNLVHHQFNTLPVEVPPSWTIAPSSIQSSELPSKLVYRTDTKQPQSPPLAIQHSTNSLCDSGVPCTVIVESTTGPTSDPSTSQSPVVATPESTWGEQTLPPAQQSRANQHQQLYSEFSLSSVPNAQELGGNCSWSSSSMYQPAQAFN